MEVPEERVPHGGGVPAPGRAGQQREQRTEGSRQVDYNHYCPFLFVLAKTQNAAK